MKIYYDAFTRWLNEQIQMGENSHHTGGIHYTPDRVDVLWEVKKKLDETIAEQHALWLESQGPQISEEDK